MSQSAQFWTKLYTTKFQKQPKRSGKYTGKFKKYIRHQIVSGKLLDNFPDQHNLYFQPTNKWGRFRELLDKRYKTEKKLLTKEKRKGLRLRGSVIANVSLLKDQYAAQILRFKSEGHKRMQVPTQFLTIEERLNTLAKSLPQGITIQFGEDFYTLNEEMRVRILELLNEDYDNLTGSNKDFIDSMIDSNIITIAEEGNVQLKNKRVGGKWFPYSHKLDKLDLKKYGIFGIDDFPLKKGDKRYDLNCLQIALQYGGMSDKEFNRLSILLKTREVALKDMPLIAKELGVYLHITTDNLNCKIKKYGNPKHKKLKLGLCEKHYFIIDKVPINYYALHHYWEIQHLPNFQHLCADGKYREKHTSSLEVVKYLLSDKERNLKKLSFNDGLLHSQFYDKVKHFDNLYYEDKCVRLNEYRPMVNNLPVYVFDFETDTSTRWYKNDKGQMINRHLPYMVSMGNLQTKKKRTFYTTNIKRGDCAYKMLCHITEDCLLLAHNCGYDWHFLINYLRFGYRKPCLRGNGLVCVNALFYNPKIKKIVKITLHDSYKKIPMPLGKFGKCFQMEQKKDIMPYGLYNEENRNRVFVPIEEGKRMLKKQGDDDKIDQFVKNIDDWGLRGPLEFKNLYNCIEYSRIYCEMDCEVLMKGYEKWRQWMMDLTAIDVNCTVSVPQLANNYLLKENCYEDVYQLSGVPRVFMQGDIKGGVCATAENKKWYGKEGKITYTTIDINSSYPHSTRSLGGFLKGKPIVLEKHQLKKEFLDQQDGYFIDVKITAVNKHLRIPYLMKKVDGINNYTNDMVGETIRLNKFSLPDAIEFQEIEYEILQGYYYNQGRNQTVNKIMEDLFTYRAKLKGEENPVQEAVKTLMCSTYGRAILNEINDETLIIKSRDKDRFKKRNFNRIKKHGPIGYSFNSDVSDKYWYFTLFKSINTHFNNAHVGAEILAHSKRTLYRVLCLAEDLNMKTYCVDTDSIHLEREDVPELAEKFQQLYKTRLIGNELGEYSVDFSMYEDKAKKIPIKEVWGIKGLWITKKVYCDHIVGKKADDTLKYEYHYRLKGVSKGAIQFHVQKERKKDPNYTVWDMYMKLYNGEEIIFDLLEGGRKARFIYNKDMTISMAQNFTRAVRVC
tara:strand:+ start:615 stop:3968 length:3354 start_codon:yes stop_codon:yes gene_type:complete